MLFLITFNTPSLPTGHRAMPPRAPRKAPGPTAAAVALTVRAPPLPWPLAGGPGPHSDSFGSHSAGALPGPSVYPGVAGISWFWSCSLNETIKL